MSKKLSGNVQNIKNSVITEIEKIYDMRCDGDFITMEIAVEMAKYTQKLGKEIAIYITRDGEIYDVIIGEAKSAKLSAARITRNSDRLCGLRCVHTHPNGNANLSEPDINSLRSLMLDCMCAIGISNGLPTSISVGFLKNEIDEKKNTENVIVEVTQPIFMHQLPSNRWLDMIIESDNSFKSTTSSTGELHSEKAILIGLNSGNEKYDTLKELSKLVQTAGGVVVDIIVQNKEASDKSFYIGKGKVLEIAQKYANSVDLYVFDDELSPMQLSNLESSLGGKVVDRTALILDIFAQRATSHEGKLQVELAQLKYRLPRTIGMNKTLSRSGGGIGAKGQGESKVELGKREVKRRVFELQNMIGELAKQRSLRRVRREKNEIPVIALVGYTNSGKSTLINALCGSSAYAKDQLFATLDPITRSVKLPNSNNALISDTVGFINKLPHDLVQAFKSTIEETQYADVVVHVVDASSEYFHEQMKVVEEVLQSIGAQDKPTIIAFNKADTPQAQENIRTNLYLGKEGTTQGVEYVCISAKTHQNIDALLEKIQSKIDENKKNVCLEIPYSRTDVAAYLHQRASVIEEHYNDDYISINVSIDVATLNSIKKMLATSPVKTDFIQ